jgi:Putative transposase
MGWFVYAKRPFAGPQAVLAYLSRYTHRVAISNSRLIAADEESVTFKVKDYRVDGPGRYTTMTLEVPEFIRRFLLHVLPKGFHRIRHVACPGPDPGACSPAARAINASRRLASSWTWQASPPIPKTRLPPMTQPGPRSPPRAPAVAAA